MNKPLFEVDAKGLARIQGDKPKGRILAELWQNAKDEDGVKNVRLNVKLMQGRPLAQFSIEDDSPQGFSDLSHAYTLFAPSYKLDNPEKSGWMNMGEKLAIVGCKWFTIETTKGTVHFDVKNQVREEKRVKRPSGTIVTGLMRMNRQEYDEALAFLKTIIVPEGINFYINDALLPHRKPLHSFKVKLPTRITDEDNMAKMTVRETTVEVHEVAEGEEPFIYEMGIPVVEIPVKWSVNVKQKVLLNKDRDNVTPAYLRSLQVFVLNEMKDKLTAQDANENWVREAGSDERCTDEAINKVVTLRYGAKRVAFDPSDPEANAAAFADGATVIPSRGLSEGERKNAYRAGVLISAGKQYKTRTAYEGGHDADVVEFVNENKWTNNMRNVVDYSKWLAKELMGVDLTVRIVHPKCKLMHFAACYGNKELHFNLLKLGHSWFSRGITDDVNELIIHEFGHEYESNHLSESYYKALCKLGAKLTRLALEKPHEFKRYSSPR